MHREERGTGQIGFSERDFKVCDLCGALNRVSNERCFSCGWSGTFHHEEEVVRQAMKEFEDYYGGMNENLVSEEILSDEPESPGLIASIVEKIKYFLSGRGAA